MCCFGLCRSNVHGIGHLLEITYQPSFTAEVLSAAHLLPPMPQAQGLLLSFDVPAFGMRMDGEITDLRFNNGYGEVTFESFVYSGVAAQLTLRNEYANGTTGVLQIKGASLNFRAGDHKPRTHFVADSLYALLGLAGQVRISIPNMNIDLGLNFKIRPSEISKFLELRQIEFGLMVIEKATGLQFAVPQHISGDEIKSIGVAYHARGKDGEALRSPIVFYETSRSRLTDDRGIYRFWSLLPGLYIVSAGGFSGLITAYDDDSPTYYPSSTLGSANQLVLNSGQELTGIDIRYRGYTGHAISGTLMGNSPPSYVEVYLFTDNGDYLESISLDPAEATGPFAFAKASDGVYSLVAVRSTENQATAISAPKRVTVNGADISGINLKLLPLGSLSGRITLENDPKLDCKSKKTNKLTEIVLSLRSVGPPKDIYPSFIESQLTNAASPDSDGRFAMKRVPAGDYRIESWAPTDDWYVSTIALGSGARRTDVAPKGIAISAGQIVSGLNVVMKNGAAGFSGDIIPTAGAALSTDLRVWLVPAEPNRVDERLSFAETEADNNGSFKFKNLAPGSYRIIAHAFHEKDSNGLAADTAEGRRRLLREAGDRAPLVELHPCEKQKGYRLKLLG